MAGASGTGVRDIPVVCDVCGHEFMIAMPEGEHLWFAPCPECQWPVCTALDAKKEEVWTSKAIATGLEELFEVRWNQKMMSYMLRIMDQRGQIGRTKGGYRLKEAKVVRL